MNRNAASHRNGMLTRLLLGVTLILGLSTGCARRQTAPTEWAAAIDHPGLPNLHRVDEGVFRGAQPSPEGIAALRGMGVRTVINLRMSDDHRRTVRNEGLDYQHVPSIPLAISDEAVVEFLQLASDPARQPVFVHCRRGADRTGMMTAVYRVVVLGWSKEDALEEMRNGGFGYDPVFSAALATYVQNMDVAMLRRRLM